MVLGVTSLDLIVRTAVPAMGLSVLIGIQIPGSFG